MNQTQRGFRGSLLGAGLLALLLLAPAVVAMTAAGEDEQAVSEELMAAQGKVTFRVYCSNCHGVDARGEGKIAPLLKVQPADLTKLIREEDHGEFPADRVREAIDGRKEVRGHGMREMPVWGDAFQPTEDDPLDPEKVQTAEKRIDELVAYLRTLQVSE
jgi:mono/diheme cytochrome c family protein